MQNKKYDVQFFTQMKMDKSKNQTPLFFKGIKCLVKWIRRLVFIIMAALMIGFTNAFYDECRMINDTKNFDEQEQAINDDRNRL